MSRVLVILAVCCCIAQSVVAIILPCSRPDQCDADQCCVSNAMPDGRRQLFDAGHCAAMGTKGAPCLVRYQSGQPSHMVYSDCPCENGLSCHGSGQFDIPLGEVGTCM